MITPGDIYQKAARRYLPFLRAWLQEETFFPLDFPVGKLPSDYVGLRAAVRQLLSSSKEQRGYGYVVESQAQHMRSHGVQTLPKRVVIETEQDFLRLIEKEDEFQRFQQDVALIRARFPQLAAWIIDHPQQVIEQHDIWSDLLAVCAYFRDHPRPQLYQRELPIPVHTKFIEQHRGILRDLLEAVLPAEAIATDAAVFEQRFGLRVEEPQVRVRFLDQQLSRCYGLLLDELCIPCVQFAALDLLRGQRCIITENKMTFLTLPPQRDTFALFGGGFMVHHLSQIAWLADCAIVYWGDLDAQGFQILSQLRAIFPHVVSIMMDAETLETFAAFCVESAPCLARTLPHLTSEEYALFVHLAEKCIRLEQERISHSYALGRLSRLSAEL